MGQTINKLSSQFKAVADIKAAFKRLDANGDGQICRDELRNGMKLSDADLDVVFALGDLDGDGEISLGEFIRVMSPLTATALARFRNTFTVIEDVVSAFRIIDSNNDGALSKSELESGMNSFGKKFTQVEIDSVFSLADVNADGEINYSEFVSVMFPAAANAIAKFRKQNRTLKNARDAYDRLDIDGDGEITYDELVAGLGGDYTANEIDAIFAMGDTDQDGHISFLEFSKIMLPSCQEALNKFWKCSKTVTNVRDAFKKFDADGDGQISRTEVESAFRRWDANKDGSISIQEMKAGLSGCGIMFTEQEAETCFAVADRNGDNEVSMEEFVDLLSSSHTSSTGPIKKFFEFCVEQAFNNIDTNKDGSISYQELSNSLRKAGFSDQEIHTIFALADHDGDGEVSLHELLRSLSRN